MRLRAGWAGWAGDRDGGGGQKLCLSICSTGTPQRSRIMVPTSPKLGLVVCMGTMIWVGASSFVDFSEHDWAGWAGLAGLGWLGWLAGWLAILSYIICWLRIRAPRPLARRYLGVQASRAASARLIRLRLNCWNARASGWCEGEHERARERARASRSGGEWKRSRERAGRLHTA